MASNVKIATSARNAACNAIVDLVDAGSGDGTCEIRTGSPPTNVADADSGDLLAEPTFSPTAFGNAGASNPGEAIAAAITSDTSAAASGDAGHFRVKDSDSNTIWQGTAGESADTPDMVFDNKSIVLGGTVAISSFKATIPIQ